MVTCVYASPRANDCLTYQPLGRGLHHFEGHLEWQFRDKVGALHTSTTSNQLLHPKPRQSCTPTAPRTRQNLHCIVLSFASCLRRFIRLAAALRFLVASSSDKSLASESLMPGLRAWRRGDPWLPPLPARTSSSTSSCAVRSWVLAENIAPCKFT